MVVSRCFGASIVLTSVKNTQRCFKVSFEMDLFLSDDATRMSPDDLVIVHCCGLVVSALL